MGTVIGGSGTDTQNYRMDSPLNCPWCPNPCYKILKLAWEVKCLATLMTAAQDLHDIHTLLYLLVHWPHLTEPAQHYATHHLCLLYITITKGWSVTLFYDQQGTNKFLGVAPDFWSGYQPPRPTMALLASQL